MAGGGMPSTAPYNTNLPPGYTLPGTVDERAGQTSAQVNAQIAAAWDAYNARNAGTANGTGAGAAVKAAASEAGLPSPGQQYSSLQGLFGAAAGAPGTPGAGGGNAPTIGYPGASGGASSSLTGLTAAAMEHGSGPAGAPTLAPVDTTAAQSAAFGKAKDQVGLETSGALTGLRSALGGRGMLGSGLEERGTAAVANKGQGELGDVSRQAAVTSADLANENAKTNFQGGITERGQTLASEAAANSLASGERTAGYTGAITQRGQDITAQSERDRLAMEQAQLIAGQRSQVLSGLMSALSPAGKVY